MIITTYIYIQAQVHCYFNITVIYVNAGLGQSDYLGLGQSDYLGLGQSDYLGIGLSLL